MQHSDGPVAYKFVGLERISYFADGLLRFTQPSALNDPFECLPGLSFDILSALLTADSGGRAAVETLTKERADRVLRPYLLSIVRRIDGILGILCLSERWDSTLMWSHYANSNTGFCIGFDVNHPFFSATGSLADDWGPLRAVNYSSARVNAVLNTISKAEFLDLIYCKNLDWSYERELRLVRSLEKAEKIIEPNAQEAIYLFEVPHDAVREICIGARATSGLRQELVERGKELNVPVYSTSMSYREFSVQRWLEA